MALAGAVHGRGRDGLLRDKSGSRAGHPGQSGGRAGGRADPGRAARRGDTLDRPGDGPGRRDLPALGAADLAAHGLQPHRITTFKLSKDPAFAAKLQDIVGLYVEPPARSRSCRSTRKARSRRSTEHSPGCPSKKAGRDDDRRLQPQRDHHPVRRAQHPRRHRHRPVHAAPPPSGVHPLPQRLEREVPAGKLVHVILDNYASHKHPKVPRWLDRHPRWAFHYTPTSCSWLNAVETVLCALPTPPQARRVPLDRRPPGRHQPLHRGAQCRAPNPSSGPPIPTSSSARSRAGLKR